MKIQAKIRVCEQSGIRRFLYPLKAMMKRPEGVETASLGLLTIPGGDPVPTQISTVKTSTGTLMVIDFAVSLAPFEECELQLAEGIPQKKTADPLRLTAEADGGVRNEQERFQLSIAPTGMIRSVQYDGVSHLRGPSRIQHNGRTAEPRGSQTSPAAQNAFLTANVYASAELDGCSMLTLTEITACKSWVVIDYVLPQLAPDDEISFHLPFAAASPTLLCDFGIGGGVYGKLNAATADEIAWRSEFTPGCPVNWSLLTNGRLDFQGQTDTAALYRTQQWFHLIDGNKALAVAVTKVPDSVVGMDVFLNAAGDIDIRFIAGQPAGNPARFSVCYHFLNNVPAISAATNPQSILLPPEVQVIPE